MEIKETVSSSAGIGTLGALEALVVEEKPRHVVIRFIIGFWRLMKSVGSYLYDAVFIDKHPLPIMIWLLFCYLTAAFAVAIIPKEFLVWRIVSASPTCLTLMFFLWLIARWLFGLIVKNMPEK